MLTDVPAPPDMTDLAVGLYEAVLDGRPLLAALAPTMERIGASSRTILQVRYRDGRPTESVLSGEGGCSTEAYAAYGRQWVRHCPRAHAFRRLEPGPHGVSDLIPIEDWRKSRVWNEWGRPNAAGFHLLAVPLWREGDNLAGVFFNRREGEHAFSPQDRELLLQAFPHLRRAFAAEARLAAARHGPEEAARRGLDALPDGVALIDAARGLVFANGALRRMAAENDGFRLDADGLDMPDPAGRLAFSRAVTAALAAADGKVGLLASAGSFSIPRPSGLPPFLLRALPVRPGEVPGAFRGALLLVTDGARRPRPNAALLGRMFNLTPAEAHLAAAIGAGRTMAEHAKRRGVSIETIRTHMAALRRKTGLHRQADLTALLARLPG